MTGKDIELYPHNQEAYEKIKEKWKTSNKAAVVHATGTGKSYIILKCLYDIPKQNKIVLAPSNHILRQLKKQIKGTIPNTKLITYSKLSKMTEEDIKKLDLSLIVLDEFHRCGADEWGKGVQDLLEKFSNSKILGTTATPIRYLDNSRNMADELFDGNVVSELSLFQAIVRKILPMPLYVSSLYTFGEELENFKDKVNNSKNEEEQKIEIIKEADLFKKRLEKSKGVPNILKKYLENNKSDKFIVFCKDVEHLQEMKINLVKWFEKSKVYENIESYIIYSEYDEKNRELEEFKKPVNPNTVKLLFSIDMFNEGIHIKDVTGVILLRPTMSSIIYYQQIGRAMDVNGDRHPIIFDLVNNFDNLGANQFKSELEKCFKEESESLEISGDSKDKIIDISEFTIYDESLDFKEFLSRLGDILIDDWNDMYNRLVEYKNKYGDCNIKQNYTDKKLYNWVRIQREYYKLNTINSDRMKKLREIDFVFNPYEEKWNDLFERLRKYKEKNNNIDIPYKFITEDGYGLYDWVSKQRKDYKQGKLTENKIKMLNSLDFNWSKVKSYKSQYHICNLLEQNNMTRIDLGKLLDVPSNTVYSWIKKNNIPLKYIKKIAEILNISPDIVEPQNFAKKAGVHSYNTTKHNIKTWTVTYGCKYRKSFSCKKYGEQQAYELAVQQRKQWEEEFGDNKKEKI